MEETISKKPNVISRLKTELKKPFTKNMLMFSLGTIGRDFLYFLFNSFLMTFILFTKTTDNKMLMVVGAIIVVARIFDALNDVRNLEQAIKSTKKYGGQVEATLSYTMSPIHSEASSRYFA